MTEKNNQFGLSLLCIPSLHNNKSQQTYAPQNELQMLCIAAYEQYQLEIINDDNCIIVM